MPYVWKAPKRFLRYRGVSIYHAYKDELSDSPLEFWYSTCGYESPGSGCEFDVRDLPGYKSRRPFGDPEHDREVIRAAIQAGLLEADAPLRRRGDD